MRHALRAYSYAVVLLYLFVLFFISQPPRLSATDPTIIAEYVLSCCPRWITYDLHDGVYFATLSPANRIAIVQLRSDGVTITEVSIPVLAGGLGGIAYDDFASGFVPSSSVWFTMPQANKIGRLLINHTPISLNGYIEYQIPTINSSPTEIAVEENASGGGSVVWFTEFNAGKVARLDARTGPNPTITEFQTPTPNSGPYGITVINNQAGVTGHPVWFTEQLVGQVAVLNPTTNAIAEYQTPSGIGSFPTGIMGECATIATFCGLGFPNQRVWFVEQTGNKIGRFAIDQGATLGTFFEYPVPTGSASPQGINLDQSGRVWFTEFNANKIGALDPSTSTFIEYLIPTPASQPFQLESRLRIGEIFVTESAAGASKLAQFTQLPVPVTTVATTVTATVNQASSTAQGTTATSAITTSTQTIITTSGTSSLTAASSTLTTQPYFTISTTTGTLTTLTSATTPSTTPTTITGTGTSTTTTTTTSTSTTLTTTTQTTITQTLPTSITTFTQRTTTTSTRILGNIPGFPVESILAGLALGLAALAFAKRLASGKRSRI